MIESRASTGEEEQLFGALARVADASSSDWGSRTGVLLVHGRAGNETVMWVFSRAIEQASPIVVAPRGLLEDPVHRKNGTEFSWWDFENRPDSEESPAPRATLPEHVQPGHQVLKGIIENMPDLYGVDPKKIVGIGFSQGAALLGTFVLQHPGQLKGCAMIAGFIPSALQQTAQGAGSLPSIFVSHGTKDEVIPYSKAEESVAFLRSQGFPVEFHSDDVGHKISSSGIRSLQAWFREVSSS